MPSASPADASQRIAAGVEYALNRATEEGHVYLPSAELLENADEHLKLGVEKAAAGLLHLKQADRVKVAAGPGEEAESLHWAVAQIYEPDNTQHLPPSCLKAVPVRKSPGANMSDSLLQAEHAVYLTPLYYSEGRRQQPLDPADVASHGLTAL